MKCMSFVAALAGAIFLTGAASAATLIYDQTLTPQSGSNSTTFFDSDNDFSESWDFSGASYTSIESFVLTLEATGATGESGVYTVPFFGFKIPVNEDWKIRAQGSTSGENDDIIAGISNGTNTYTINAASDTGGRDVFAHSVGTENFTLWLAEESADSAVSNPSITISSARLEVFGEVAAVPLPAGAPLLLAGLGGLALLRRRKAASKA